MKLKTASNENMIGGVAMKKYKKHLMVDALIKNEEKLLNNYINGYYSAVDISNYYNLSRKDFYNAVNELSNRTKRQITKERMDNKAMIIDNIIQQISLCIPFEQMKFEEERLFGKNSKYHNAKSNYDKKSRTNSLIFRHNKDFDEYLFINQKTFNSWYKKYLANEYLKNGKLNISQIGRNLNIKINQLYRLRDYVEVNPNQFLTDVSKTQEDIFKSIIEIYNEYKNGYTMQDIAYSHKISLDYVDSIMNSFILAERDISNK